MRYRTTVQVNAPRERVWELLADVGSWPDWTPSVTEVRAAAVALHEGQRVRVTMRGRPPVTFVVQSVREGTSFSWGRRTALVTEWADHRIRDRSDGVEVDLSFALLGPLGSALGWLGRAKVEDAVNTEARSLKERAEQGE